MPPQQPAFPFAELPEDLLHKVLGLLPRKAHLGEMECYIKDESRWSLRNASQVCQQCRRVALSLPWLGSCGEERIDRHGLILGAASLKAFAAWGCHRNLVAAFIGPIVLSQDFLEALKPLWRVGGLRVLELETYTDSSTCERLSELSTLQSLAVRFVRFQKVNLGGLGVTLASLAGLKRLELALCPNGRCDVGLSKAQNRLPVLTRLTGLTSLLLLPVLCVPEVTKLPLLQCLTLQGNNSLYKFHSRSDVDTVCFDTCAFSSQLTSLCLKSVRVEGVSVRKLQFVKRLVVWKHAFGVVEEGSQAVNYDEEEYGQQGDWVACEKQRVKKCSWWDLFCLVSLENLLFRPLVRRDYFLDALTVDLACQLTRQSVLRSLRVYSVGLDVLRPYLLSKPRLTQLSWSLLSLVKQGEGSMKEVRTSLSEGDCDLLVGLPDLRALSIEVGEELSILDGVEFDQLSADLAPQCKLKLF